MIRSFLLLVLLFGPMFAQTAQVTGRVLDPSGAMVSAVSVVLTNVATGVSKSQESDQEGRYVVPLLQPGEYRISVQKEGFRSIERDGIILEVDQVARIDFTLEVGSVAESISVTASAPLLDQETSSLGQVIENKRITEIPLNGRNVFSLVQLAAGVQPLSGINAGFNDNSSFNASNLSIGGGRGAMNALLLDGANNASPQREEAAVAPSIDAVEEFKVYTNGASAEFGRTSGGVISVVTKSGTNSFHGSGYEFVRNEVLDARNTFAASRAPFRFNQFGGTIGGPIRIPKLYDGRNRSFFFLGYEGYRYVNYADQIFTIPTEKQRAGDFSSTFAANGRLMTIYDPGSTRQNPSGNGSVRDPFAGNRIPQNRFDPVAQNVMAVVPLPNRAPTNPLTNVQNFAQQNRRASDNDQWMGRLDHYFTPMHRLSFRLTRNLNLESGGNFYGGFLNMGGQQDRYDRDYLQGVLSETHVLRPNITGEFRFGYVLTQLLRESPSSVEDVDRLGFPSMFPEWVPGMVVEDFTSLAISTPTRHSHVSASMSETLTMVSGKHTLKFGGEIRSFQRNSLQNQTQTAFNRAMTNNPQSPAGSGYGVATFLLGAVNDGFLSENVREYWRAKYYALFLQDDWKITPRLTLNLGLRYDVETEPVEKYDRRSNFNLTKINPLTTLPGVLEYAAVDFGSSPVPTDFNNFGPRVGFAYTVDSANTTVIRGSYAIFYLPGFETFQDSAGWSVTNNLSNTSGGISPTFYLSTGPSSLIEPLGSAAGPAGFLGATVNHRLGDTRTSYSQQWSMGLQRSLPGGWVAEAFYTGAKGTKLGVGGQNAPFNNFDPQYLSLGFALQTQVPNPFASLGIFGPTVARSQLLRPYPAYQAVNINTPHWGASIYHGLQLTARKRLSGSHSVLASYTVGKMIDDIAPSLIGFSGYNTGATAYQNQYDRRAERSISPADVSQRLTGSYIVQLPFGKGQRWVTSGVLEKLIGGWQCSGVLSLSTGQPLVVRGAQNNAADRPNSAGRSAYLASDERTRYEWFDTSAFTAPALFTFGNLGRVLPDVRAPGIVNLDVGLHKFFSVGEHVRIQLRGEAFNVTNKVNWAGPNVNALNAAFGQISATSTPARILQLGMKVLF
jgi:outer membrane receptor protein involved in Fe transport